MSASRHRGDTAPCDECDDGTVRPMGMAPEFVCGLCDAEMSSSRFAIAKRNGGDAE